MYDGTVAVIAPQPSPVNTLPQSIDLVRNLLIRESVDRTHVRKLVSGRGHDDCSNDEDQDV